MTDSSRTVAPAEWNAASYHTLSDPHVGWGDRTLARLPLRGDETVLDAGCGSGRITAMLLERLPDGCAIGFDRSANMLAEAEANLRPRYGDRVTFLQGDLASLELPEPIDAIFSTATFHWVLDHDALFASLFHALRPGGLVVAQCGGGPNLAGLLSRVRALADQHAWGAPLRSWAGPWEFADAATTAQRLHRAGFVEVATSVEEAPTTLADAPTYRDFLHTVVLRAHLDRLADDRARAALLDALTAVATTDDPSFSLDYWRLNLAARRPA